LFLSLTAFSPGFYTTVWQLSVYDIAPPSSKYDEEGAKLRALSRQEDSKFNVADRSSDRAKRSTAATHRTRRDRYNSFGSILAQEFSKAVEFASLLTWPEYQKIVRKWYRKLATVRRFDSIFANLSNGQPAGLHRVHTDR
jgi:hypothetical protein